MALSIPNVGEYTGKKRVHGTEERVLAVSGVSTSSTHKNPIAELRNGKVIFKQKPISLEKASETMQEIVKFREMLDLRVQNQDQPLASMPEEHKPLIVKLAQESDKGIIPLAKQIRSIILPGPGEAEDAHRLSLESTLPLSVLEDAIKAVMTRINYGLDGPLGHRLPATVCVWRWEVRDDYKDWLPKSARDTADTRLAERIQASADLRAVFGSLPQAERDAILDPKGVLKLPAKKDTNKFETDTISLRNNESSSEHLPKEASIDVTDEVLSENLAPKGRVKRALDPEKAAKTKDREEKRAAKVEKEKKQKEAQERSRSIMANFFGKAKPSAQDSPTKDSGHSAEPSVDNDFQRTFRPFMLKKDAELAPHNWFLEGEKRFRNRMSGTTHEEAIVIDDDISMRRISSLMVSSDAVAIPATAVGSPRSLREFVAELRQSSLSSFVRMGKMTSPKFYNPRNVRDTISQLNDAEIAGDPAQVRHLLSILRDRQFFSAKVLIFHEDSRPGYYGTWTRHSRIVGPRTPLERDVLAHDYGYDSGEEWEDEGAGDADDVVEDEDDEPDAEDADSDLDSWLVEDDDETQSPPDLDDLSSPPPDLSVPPPKRKAENIEKRSDKKRKVVVPLVPYVKGPFWESYIGKCDCDPFGAYRIQLLNDTPYPVDPFTFMTVASEGQKPQAVVSSAVLPGEVQPPVGTAALLASKRIVNSTPKTVFPEAHLSTLVSKITQLATPSFTFLIESIYQDLRAHKIKKNAIEAKVREISEKSKDKKVWIVKQGV